MGCGASTIESPSIFITKLRKQLDELSGMLDEFEKMTFTTKEEMNALAITSQITSLQEKINESLKNARREVEQIEQNDTKYALQKELEELTRLSVMLYNRNSDIIKRKLDRPIQGQLQKIKTDEGINIE